MPAWKVLLIGAFGCACVALVTTLFIVPFAYDGTERWLWVGGLLAAIALTGTLFILFLKGASRALDVKPRRTQS
jgi:hypothetical protein